MKRHARPGSVVVFDDVCLDWRKFQGTLSSRMTSADIFFQGGQEEWLDLQIDRGGTRTILGAETILRRNPLDRLDECVVLDRFWSECLRDRHGAGLGCCSPAKEREPYRGRLGHTGSPLSPASTLSSDPARRSESRSSREWSSYRARFWQPRSCGHHPASPDGERPLRIAARTVPQTALAHVLWIFPIPGPVCFGFFQFPLRSLVRIRLPESMGGRSSR